MGMGASSPGSIIILDMFITKLVYLKNLVLSVFAEISGEEVKWLLALKNCWICLCPAAKFLAPFPRSPSVIRFEASIS